MAKFSMAEKALIRRIGDDRLHTSLELIRQAMEDIWAPDAPRIIQDYTDHGIEHCERLAEFATKLIAKCKLSDRELYSLLASVYLHDVGMQCDVKHYPQIKSHAESLGAMFEIAFTPGTANSYSIEEQKAVRKNHHILSIAWIHYARETGQTALGTGARSIPAALVADIMDVCSHHTKLPITSCRIAFNQYPRDRKQFTAALLRFSDELDIEATRVNIESVKTFSVDPSNSIYWWIHNATTLTFTTPHLIHISIALCDNDARKYGALIHKMFITEFRTKNAPVITILAKNDVCVIIDTDSKVITNEYAVSLPEPILQALEDIGRGPGPLLELADEVKTWLRSVRYEVGDLRPRGDRLVDLNASLDQGTVSVR